MPSIDELRAAVAAEMPSPWTVVSTETGFEVRMPIRPETDSSHDYAYIEVTADAGLGTISTRVRRAAERVVDTTSRRPLHYSRRKERGNYSGMRMQMSLRRTPEGLQRNHDDPWDTGGRVADITRIAEAQGWRTISDAGAGSAFSGMQGSEKKGLFVIVGIIAGAFLLIGGAVAAIFIAVLSNVLG